MRVSIKSVKKSYNEKLAHLKPLIDLPLDLDKLMEDNECISGLVLPEEEQTNQRKAD